jgi:hypothetical protein
VTVYNILSLSKLFHLSHRYSFFHIFCFDLKDFIWLRTFHLKIYKDKDLYYSRLIDVSDHHLPWSIADGTGRIRDWRYQYVNRRRTNNNGQKKINKRTNNDLQNTTQETKDWATRTLPKTWVELSCSGRVDSTCSTSYKPGDKSGMRKEQESAYDKWNISVVIYGTNIP